MSRQIILAKGRLKIVYSFGANKCEKNKIYINGDPVLSDHSISNKMLKKFKEQDGENVKLILEIEDEPNKELVDEFIKKAKKNI